MAKLTDDLATAEFLFPKDYDSGYVHYGMRLRYGDVPLINPLLLPDDLITFDQYEFDSLIPFFESLLRNERHQTYNSLEPEVRLEVSFRKKLGLIEAEQNPKLLFISEDRKEILRAVDIERERAGGRLPDDCFEFLIMFNESKLETSGKTDQSYGGFVPAMHITVTREALEKFVVDLKADYAKSRSDRYVIQCGGNIKYNGQS